jgi:hypothetical protein
MQLARDRRAAADKATMAGCIGNPQIAVRIPLIRPVMIFPHLVSGLEFSEHIGVGTRLYPNIAGLGVKIIAEFDAFRP